MMPQSRSFSPIGAPARVLVVHPLASCTSPVYGRGKLSLIRAFWTTLLIACYLVDCGLAKEPEKSPWPELTTTARPWTYLWCMGSAVDRENMTKQLDRFHAAGLGGIHIIPIYGAKGYESRYIEYLSPKWMEMLEYTIEEARKRGMDVDMSLGTGWCFGGPNVTEHESGLRATCKVIDVPVGRKLEARFAPGTTYALIAYDKEGKPKDITKQIEASGQITWKPEGGAWKVYAVSEKSGRRKVKRAALGGEGYMLNPFYGEAIDRYLERFTKAFSEYKGPRPRAIYQDSYEYFSEWSPDLFAEFEKRRGYRLQDHLPQMFGSGSDDATARVKCDYRETLSDMMVETFTQTWASWGYEHGMKTRNQAHGSPGNLLDLYAAVDIPETEMFSRDREMLVCKFASSAAHVVGGKPLVSSETGTWLAEHFTETLADMKRLVDEMYVSGINHVFYHGTCYSPDDAAWPGWLFYAATEMNPRNAFWHDVPALNAYIARCQSVLQADRPDNDILLYWPIHDLWHDPSGTVQMLTVHQRAWLNKQPIGETAKMLWNRGYAFDYISDRQLQNNIADHDANRFWTCGARYLTVVVPPCEYMPPDTMKQLKDLAHNGTTVIFQDRIPHDVPGLGNLERRRKEFRELLADLKFDSQGGKVREAKVGTGRFLVGDLETALALAKIPRETLVDRSDLLFIRRRSESPSGTTYFICNHGEKAFDGWIAPAAEIGQPLLMDPWTGRTGRAATRQTAAGKTQLYLQLPPGGSIIIRPSSEKDATNSSWAYWQTDGGPIALSGSWKVQFLEGGPTLPKEFETAKLASWTELGGAEATRFAGTARYSIAFDAPKQGKQFQLDLGRVCQSARVRLNGRELGISIAAPHQMIIDDLKPFGNVLEVDATNLSANRLRDLDRRGVVWRKFNDINFASISYKQFDASKWPVQDSGLLGPVPPGPSK